MFVLLKIVLFFVRPLIWALALLLYAAFAKNAVRKRRALLAALALLFVFTNPFLARTVLSAYEAKPVNPETLPHFRTGVVLGGMVTYRNGESTGYFNNVVDRFVQTALLYKMGKVENIVIAAGNGALRKNDFSEALFVKERLVTLGIPAERIYTDSRSRNTLENAQNAKRIADSAGLGDACLLISSATHLPRARRVFEKVGFKPTLFPGDFLSKRVENNFVEDNLLPAARWLSAWDALLKEWLGTVAYAVSGKG